MLTVRRVSQFKKDWKRGLEIMRFLENIKTAVSAT
jgi:hypothetical protein